MLYPPSGLSTSVLLSNPSSNMPKLYDEERKYFLENRCLRGHQCRFLHDGLPAHRYREPPQQAPVPPDTDRASGSLYGQERAVDLQAPASSSNTDVISWNVVRGEICDMLNQMVDIVVIEVRTIMNQYFVNDADPDNEPEDRNEVDIAADDPEAVAPRQPSERRKVKKAHKEKKAKKHRESDR